MNSATNLDYFDCWVFGGFESDWVKPSKVFSANMVRCAAVVEQWIDAYGLDLGSKGEFLASVFSGWSLKDWLKKDSVFNFFVQQPIGKLRPANPDLCLTRWFEFEDPRCSRHGMQTRISEILNLRVVKSFLLWIGAQKTWKGYFCFLASTILPWNPASSLCLHPRSSGGSCGETADLI